MNRVKINKIIILAFYLAISIIVSYVETFIPIPIPGVKLGLANVIILFLHYEDNILYILSISSTYAIPLSYN